MLDDTLPVTLQYQLRGKLLDKLRNRTWGPGGQIPSERELCDEYGVSRMTVREVLKDLVQEGYLVRKQGKGTFVSMPKFQHELTSSYSLSQELEREGISSDFQVLHFELVKVTPSMRELFHISENSLMFEIIRLRLIGGEPFAWEKALVPADVMERATEREVSTDGLYPTIYRCSGLLAEEAEVDAEAVNCPPDIAQLLQIKKNTAVLHLTRITSAGNRCIEHCDSYIRSEKYKYKYKQTLRQHT